jgi:gas vesicle protein
LCSAYCTIQADLFFPFPLAYPQLEYEQIEQTKKTLKEQWTRNLLKVLDDDIKALEERVKKGREEVDVLRRNLSSDGA